LHKGLLCIKIPCAVAENRLDRLETVAWTRVVQLWHWLEVGQFVAHAVIVCESVINEPTTFHYIGSMLLLAP